MQAETIRSGAVVSIFLATATAFAAHAQDDCKPVHFDRGIAPLEDSIRCTFDAGAGQTANQSAVEAMHSYHVYLA